MAKVPLSFFFLLVRSTTLHKQNYYFRHIIHKNAIYVRYITFFFQFSENYNVTKKKVEKEAWKLSTFWAVFFCVVVLQ